MFSSAATNPSWIIVSCFVNDPHNLIHIAVALGAMSAHPQQQCKVGDEVVNASVLQERYCCTRHMTLSDPIKPSVPRWEHPLQRRGTVVINNDIGNNIVGDTHRPPPHRTGPYRQRRPLFAMPSYTTPIVTGAHSRQRPLSGAPRLALLSAALIICGLVVRALII